MDEIDFLEQNAVNAAISYQWADAIKLNKKILKQHKKNIPALLRLAYAYMQSDQLTNAKKYYKQVQKIQPVNQVAQENLERIKILHSKKIKNQTKEKVSYNPELFLESTGKTKSVKLVNLGQKNTLAQLSVGQEVTMHIKKRKVDIRSRTGEYIGCLPDDLSKRLRLFLKAKSEYTAYIKENNLNNLTVFIREEKKGKKVANFISFPVDLSTNINEIGSEIQKEDTLQEIEEETDQSELDLEKIADSVDSDDKVSLPYETEDEDEET